MFVKRAGSGVGGHGDVEGRCGFAEDGPLLLSGGHGRLALRPPQRAPGFAPPGVTADVSEAAVFAPGGRLEIPFRTQACHPVVTRLYSDTREKSLLGLDPVTC